MDKELLATKGIVSSDSRPGFVDGFELRIGARATLLRQAGSRAYGVVMDIEEDDASDLYSEVSVADYVPESVTVVLEDDTEIEAACYNLPAEKLAGSNSDYARSLLKVADRLGFPKSYLDQIRKSIV